jgi:hypothetical protein
MALRIHAPHRRRAALRARNDALDLSDAAVDAIAGLTSGHTGKVLGPSREKRPLTYKLLSIIGALGLAIQLVEDPDATVARRWQPRGPGGRAGNGRWARKSPEQRQAPHCKAQCRTGCEASDRSEQSRMNWEPNLSCAVSFDGL